jgi:hypothetical protein
MSDIVIDRLEAALLDLRLKYEKESGELQEAIARLKRERLQASQAEPDHAPQVVPGEFKTMGMSAALQAYLNRRKGQRVPVARAAIDLALGGVQMGKPYRHERNLKICISNNRKLFVFDADDSTVRLEPAARPHTHR